MSHLFCKSCSYPLLAKSRFCEECGTPTAVHPHEPASRISAFFAQQATLSLFTLLVFSGLVIALAPAGWRYVGLQIKPGVEQPTSLSDTRSLAGQNTTARCNQIVVIFSGAATVKRISALLEQLDATIVFGPNENGAFELSTPAVTAAAVTDALNKADDAVVAASLQRRCL